MEQTVGIARLAMRRARYCDLTRMPSSLSGCPLARSQILKPDRVPSSLSGACSPARRPSSLLRMRYPEQRSICRRGNGLPASSSSERDATRKPSCS